tara:strand:- start:90 stop:404 length:315 start_codon:yes stop_codon:yes gene_type:complete
MKAICIDSSNKPEGISEYEWIEEGMVYTIIGIAEMALQNGRLGIELEEVTLTSASAPYKYFSIERFLLIPEDAEVRLKTMKETIKKEIKKMDIYATDADLSKLD